MKPIFFILSIVLAGPLHEQILPRQIIGAAGTKAVQVGNIKFGYTAGEVAVQTFVIPAASPQTYREGFWQSEACLPPNPPLDSTPIVNLSICPGEQTTLRVVGVSTGTLRWYDSANGGTLLGDGEEFTTPPLYATTSYFIQDSTCAASRTRTEIVVTVNPAIVIDIPVPDTLNCIADSIKLMSNVGSGYSYTWSTDNGNILSGANTATPVVNAPGTYELILRNTITGCADTATTTVKQDILIPDAAIDIPLGLDTLTCSITSVGLSAITTVTNPAYLWSGPNGFNSALQNLMISDSGSYSLLITNLNNGCTNTAITQLYENTQTPSASAQVNDSLTCIISVVELFAGTNVAPNANFLWNGPNNFNSTAQNPSVNMPGIYTVVVTDVINGCTNSAITTVGQNVTLPSATANGGTLTCTDPMVQLYAGSNTPNVIFSWTGPNNFSSTVQNPQVTTAGVYTVIVTIPVNGCSATANATVNLDADLPLASANTSEILDCNTSTVQINGNGSAQGPNFTYLWTTVDGNIVSSETEHSPVVDEPGTYLLVVTDQSNGCTNTAEALVQETAEAITWIDTDIIQPNCAGSIGGSIEVVLVAGGTGPFEYGLNNVYQNSDMFTGLGAGTYTLQIKSEEGCLYDTTFVLEVVDSFIVTVPGQPFTINSGDMVKLEPEVINGQAPFEFAWDNDNSKGLSCTDCREPEARPEFNTRYLLLVMDANGCSDTASVFIIVKNSKLGQDIIIPGSGNDGNDALRFPEIGEEDMKQLILFNRWGQVVYEPKCFGIDSGCFNNIEGWAGVNQHGDELPEGTYYYVLFTKGDAHVSIINGSVLVIR